MSVTLARTRTRAASGPSTISNRDSRTIRNRCNSPRFNRLNFSNRDNSTHSWRDRGAVPSCPDGHDLNPPDRRQRQNCSPVSAPN